MRTCAGGLRWRARRPEIRDFLLAWLKLSLIYCFYSYSYILFNLIFVVGDDGSIINIIKDSLGPHQIGQDVTVSCEYSSTQHHGQPTWIGPQGTSISLNTQGNLYGSLHQVGTRFVMVSIVTSVNVPSVILDYKCTIHSCSSN